MSLISFFKNRQIKNFILMPHFQFKFIVWITLSGFVLSFINASIFYYYIHENYSILVELSPMTDQVKEQLFSELNSIILKLGMFSLIFLLLSSFIGLIFSHQVVGPLIHFKNVFNLIKNGENKYRIQLRKNDEFKDIANEFNEMMDTLQKNK